MVRSRQRCSRNRGGGKRGGEGGGPPGHCAWSPPWFTSHQHRRDRRQEHVALVAQEVVREVVVQQEGFEFLEGLGEVLGLVAYIVARVFSAIEQACGVLGEVEEGVFELGLRVAA